MTTCDSYDPSSSIFAGMTVDALRAALASAQAAYVTLSTGGKVASASYSQGDGVKSVQYTPATIGGLVMLIKQLQAQLGIVPRSRRPNRFVFR